VDFAPQQAQALDAVNQWLKTKSKPWFYLGGYAGTGKTTVAKHFAGGVDRPKFGAYTGKASEVMRKKGCKDASTIHKLIYKYDGQDFKGRKELEKALHEAIKDGDAKLVSHYNHLLEEAEKQHANPMFSVKEGMALADADLLVIDECSMINERMAMDILSFKVPVLVLGDPAQLPPVRGAGYFTNQDPDFMLTEVHRQAQGNPVLMLATEVRKGNRLVRGKYGDSEVMAPSKVHGGIMTEAGVILVGMNKTRLRCNKFMRGLLKRDDSPYPVRDDKLISLTNMKAHPNGQASRFYNGTTFVAMEDGVLSDESDDPRDNVQDIWLQVVLEDGTMKMIDATSEYFKRYEKPHFQDPRGYHDKQNERIHDVDFAYALTVHKSQGSQWDDVVIMDDGFLKWKPEQRKMWLYTAITRAAEKITIGLTRG
jgi:exodeoxyribonuclease-5